MAADVPWMRSVRTRTTLSATVVVAVALLMAAVALLLVVKSSLIDGAENAAEHRADDLAAQIELSGPPAPIPSKDKSVDDPDDVVWQVFDEHGQPLSASQQLVQQLPRVDEEVVHLAGSDHPYLVVEKEASFRDQDYTIVVAETLENVDEAWGALTAPLLIGLPILLVVVSGTTWLVASRALRPVERIRREVELITGSSLQRRVFEPTSGDEIERLAQTMNQMLSRLQESRDRQQQFMADASHELRSPLTSIRQAAEVTQVHPDAMSEGELAETVVAEAFRMQTLVDQLLLLTRSGEVRSQAPRKDIDLDDLVMTEVRRVARTGLTIDTSEVTAGRVHGDAFAVGQVVRNLVDNADRHAQSRMKVSVSSDARAVILTVEDDGPGVPEPDRQKIFERFVRLDEARSRDAGGSGLGLAIVHEVVVSHGGSVFVDTSPLGGARFEVRIPH